MQTVGAGQVEKPHGLAIGRREPPFLALDGHARVVRDLLVASGQKIEERGLAAIRIADQRGERPAPVDADNRLAHGWGTSGTARCPVDAAASARRNANVESPMRTTRGSPPGMKRARSVTRSFGMNHSSSHRAHSGAPDGGEQVAHEQRFADGGRVERG